MFKVITALACASLVFGKGSNGSQSVVVDPQSFAVLGANGSFRTSAFDFFNPTSTTPPFFQIFDESFLSILGPNPSITVVASDPSSIFAHEAPVYNAPTDEVFFVNTPNNFSENNHVSKISMKEVEVALASNKTPINVTVTELDLPDTIQMTNGGTGPFHSSLLLITSGKGSLPPSIALVNPKAPNNVTVLLDNFFGRQFNSLNDIKVHPSGNIFFTDAPYGSILGFRGPLLLPNQVYRLDPITRSVRVVATDFDKSNGLAFTADGKTAYVADSGALAGSGLTQTRPATIYAFDVDARTQVFKNRRVFAFIDTGIPDGIQVDLQGNVYSGCGEGVQVWNDQGTLLGKFFVGSVSANMVFAGDGRLVILGGTTIVVAKIAAKEIKPVFP